ncbi:hypothetical protein B0919_02725 [Hymenobacter sp. CRA2]|nr:hypothetical protein B0919_02725 [Hymenobacter sp. CRA2]
MVLATCLLPLLAPAQVITDATRAAAARDSVLHQATAIRQNLESHTSSFRMQARRLGTRRTITRGYAALSQASNTSMGEGRLSKRVLLWKQTVVHRRGGSTVETFRGFSNRQPVLWETRHNGRVTYQRLLQLKGNTPTSNKGGYGVLNGSYVHWNREQFILPAPSI